MTLPRPLLAALFLLPACRESQAPPRSSVRPDAAVTLDERGALAPVLGDTPTDRSLREVQLAVRQNPGRIRPLLRLAQLYVRKAREASDPSFYERADDAVTRALRIDPNDLSALQVRGLVLMQDHRFAEARDLATRAIARDRQQSIFYGLLGDAEMEVGHYPAAETAYQQMVNLRPNLASYSRGSWLRWLIGDPDGAIDLGRHAVEAGSPRVPEELAWTIVQLGNLHFATGDLTAARTNYEAALRVFPNYPSALDARGVVRRALGDLVGAVADARLAVLGSTTTEHLLHLGEAQRAAGQRAEADATFAQAERAGRRSDPRALSLFYANHDREPAAAVELARRELSLRPDEVYSQDALAWALFRQGQLDEAARLIDRARRLGTREARFAFHAGMIAYGRRAPEAARVLLCEALQLNPYFDVDGAAEARTVLRQLDAGACPEAPRTAPRDAGLSRDP